METDLKIDVAALDGLHRRALEEAIGYKLASDQRLLISVIEVTLPETGGVRPAQTLEDWTGVYVGLSDAEIEAVDQVARTRTNLPRNVP